MTDRPSLTEALDFTQADLSENRAGRLTTSQYDRIRRAAVDVVLRYGLGVGMGAVVVVGLALPSLDGMNPFPVAVVVLSVLTALIGATLAVTTFRRAQADLSGGRAEAVTGVAYLGSKGRTFRIGEVDLFLGAHAKAAFVPGQTYTLYLSQHSRTPLSAEPVTAA
ncbi:MAG: hypothetical protein MUF38_06775 [Anaerolineae bacterium]|nr:hypothetical protein [Anaerolineae bacterium]